MAAIRSQPFHASTMTRDFIHSSSADTVICRYSAPKSRAAAISAAP